VTAHEVHTFAEEYMADEGYDQPWKIGHGIGLVSGHEALQVQENNDLKLEPGMVIVIDPGIFAEGFDMDVPIHIEDPVLVTEDGCENLFDYTHDFITV
jgi:Xaa-Pro aminopeptidase